MTILKYVKSGLRYEKFGRQLLVRRTHTAGIIVIGDEVLKGQVKDTNSHFLSKELYLRGYRLREIVVSPDDLTILSNTITTFSRKYDKVLTTGGIGPTHDDITYEALAVAFGDELHKHPKIVEMCKEFLKTENINHPGMKLALVPLSSVLTYGIDKNTGKKSLYPNVSLKNVYVFPGVPHLCERMFHMTADQILPVVGKFFNGAIFLEENESVIAPILDEAVLKFPEVIFGSYPVFFHSYYSVKITLEAKSRNELDEARLFLRKNMTGITDYDPNPYQDAQEKFEKLQHKAVAETMQNLKKFVRENSPDNIFFYFDGGKNSTLLLHLLSIAYKEIESPMNVIYVEKNRTVTKFVEKAVKNYTVSFLSFSETNFCRFLRSDKNLKLIKGSRISDPSHQKVMQEFSGLQVFNPISHYSYHNVWEIIRALSLPYCDLYDRGYSSIHKNAKVNPKLVTDGPIKDIHYFKKAYELEDYRCE